MANLVSQSGKEFIEIFVHNVKKIPFISNKTTPSVYVTAQSKYTLKTHNIGNRANATKIIHGSEPPEWNEKITVETLDTNVSTEELYLLIFDESTKLNLAEYSLPWAQLEPFYQYNFELNKKFIHNRASNDIKLTISVIRKTPQLPTNISLELLITKFETPVTLYAVVRIISSYDSYKENFLVRGLTGVKFEPIFFSPEGIDRDLFELREQPSEGCGYPRRSLVVKNGIWNESFIFAINQELTFNEDKYLVIEFYKMKELFGWSRIKLDLRLKKALESSKAVRTEHMLLERLVGQEKGQTVEVALKLITEKSPKSGLDPSTINSLPVLNSFFNDIQPVYLEFTPLKQPKPGIKLKDIKKSNTEDVIKNERKQPEQTVITAKEPDIDTYIAHYKELINTYKRMIVDLTTENSLNKEKVRTLELANVELNTRLGDFEERKKSLLQLAERNESSRTEINASFIALSVKLKAKEKENTELGKTVTRLEGELEKKKQVEEDYRKVVSVNETQKMDLIVKEKENVQLGKTIIKLEGELEKKKEVEEAYRKAVSVSETQKRDLIVKEKENVQLGRTITKLEGELEKKKEVEEAYRKAVSVCETQRRDIVEMKNRIEDLLELEDTVKRQERVIERFEDLVKRLMKKDKPAVGLEKELDDIKVFYKF